MLIKTFIPFLKRSKLVGVNHYTSITKEKPVFTLPPYLRLSDAFYGKDDEMRNALVKSFVVHDDFLSADEEKSVFDEIEPYLKRMRYQFDHWDDAIHGYRETERLTWNVENEKIIDRVRKVAFPPTVAQLKLVHILDLAKDGYIKPHVDAIRFCGDTIAGMSLLSDSIMRLVNVNDDDLYADILLRRRSLYIMNGTTRYDYKHEILSNERSKFDGLHVQKDRRISVICRNEPKPEDKTR